ncbi:prostamide/prostaglandin F synthase-like [Ruditapes philippinarum]|uniref:prostamide/prostaglandin F synthase-like n=1 Tax=Ruditapes philippinarum TaxID=129788 RepID=UPI00295B52C7|nr:prostamide/prostaglandin F synthase-like [Ruditapes philippinarum]
MDIAKIAKNLVKSVDKGEPFCRLGAKRLSELKPRLDENNVRLVGIGLEEVGVDEFVKGEYFKGELYIDTKKEAYKALGFRRLNIFSVFPSIFGKKAREFNERVKKEKISGNMTGDGMQNGGTLIVGQGGKLLLSFRQENAPDHVENEDVLKALGLPVDTGSGGETGEGTGDGATGGAGGSDEKPPNVVCEEDVCRKV